MSLEIYINKSRIDLKSNKGIGLTFQIGSILNPSSISGNLSNSFSVPKTKNNLTVLGNLSNINSNTNIPYEKNEAKIVQNGIELFSDGYAIVESSAKDFKIVVYSGNSSLFELVKGKNVNDLDFGTHVFNITNVVNTFSGDEDYIYPIVDYGKDVELLSNNLSNNIEALIPCLFVKSILKKIADNIGFTLKGSFIDSDIYSKLLITPNNFGLGDIDLEANSWLASDGGYVVSLTPNDVHDIGYLPFGNLSDSMGGTSAFTASQEVVGTLKFGGNFSVFRIDDHNDQHALIGNSVTVRIGIYEDGIEVWHVETVQTYFLAFSLVNLEAEKTVVKFIIKPSSVYEMRVTTTTTSINDGTPTVKDFRIEHSDLVFSFKASRDVTYGSTINLSNLYNVQQDAFIKELTNIYSLTVQTDSLNKEITINYFNDISKNLNNAIDWSDKIDFNTIPSIKYKSGSFAQINNFRYSQVDEVLGEFADSKLIIQDENLEQEKDLIVLKSIAVESELRVLNTHTSVIPLQTYLGQAFDKKPNRFLVNNFLDKNITLTNNVNGGAAALSSNIPFAYFKKEGSIDSLEWSSLLLANYGTFKAIQEKFKMVTAAFRLTEVDIANLDFSIPIYLDVHDADTQINGNFYINKITNFKENKSTKVDLIRL